MSKAEKKTTFIRAWYKSECSKLCFSDRLKLARIWTEICLKDEEYEMAAAIQQERKFEIKRHAKNKWKNRNLSQKMIVIAYKLRIKVNRWIRSKLLR